MTNEKVRELRRKIDEFFAQGGRKKLARALKQAKESARAMEEALRPDPETLNKPMTI